MVACSRVEAELRSMANGICELLWIRGMLLDLGFHIHEPMRLYGDNKVAINIAHDLVQHDHTKHIEVDRYFIKEKLQSRFIYTPYVRPGDQLVDVFSKGQSSPQFHSIGSKFSMHDVYMPV